VVSESLEYDLLDAVNEITLGNLHVPALHGDLINCAAKVAES
jgi:hypothetical protein